MTHPKNPVKIVQCAFRKQLAVRKVKEVKQEKSRLLPMR